MAKRYIDTELFKQKFVRNLPAAYKALWVYIFCDCDNAGIWEVDLEVAELYTGCKFELQEVKRLFASKVQFFNDDAKAFIPDFISFQYGTLSERNPAHRGAIERLKHYNLMDVLKDGVKPAPATRRAPSRRREFIPPTLQEVAAYVKEAGLTLVDPAEFVDTYEGNGWVLGDERKPMADYKAILRSWQRRAEKAKKERELYNSKNNGSNKPAGAAANRSREVHTATAAGADFDTL